MQDFVNKTSVVREIWGKADTILFIFAGASAEFALNKAVDWLYFTGRLPADPLGRLFSTVTYAQQIVFSSEAGAHRAIDNMRAIHAGVEANRGTQIPDWAYRDVLYLLIYYSIGAYELLERKLSPLEKEEVYQVFYRVGHRMGIPDLPFSYEAWLPQRQAHLQNDLQLSKYSLDLYAQYHRHLGNFRYFILKQAQILIVPEIVHHYLKLGKYSSLSLVLPLYKLTRQINLDKFLKAILLPADYQAEIKALDKATYAPN